MNLTERLEAIKWFEDTLEVSDYEGREHDKSALLALKAYRTADEVEKILLRTINDFEWDVPLATLAKGMAQALTRERTEK